MSNKLKSPIWNKTKLTALNPQERLTLWARARTMVTEEAKALTRNIEELGLPYSDLAGLKMDDPATIKMYEIINSKEGRAACIAATDDGLPAIAGVDHMLSQALGVEYQQDNRGTVTAGILVGQMMTYLGYVQVSKRPLPEGSVAKTGAYWKRPDPGR